MAKITAPVEGFKGKVAGVEFVDGKAETTDKNAIAYFRRKGYGIGQQAPKGKAVLTEPADPRKVSAQRRGTPVRDGAVDPAEGDFLAPTNAGESNPHGPDVVSPQVHASQGVRPVKGGDVHVDDPEQQDAEETEHTEASTDGTPVPGSAGAEPPAGNASADDWRAYARPLAQDSEEAAAIEEMGRDELRAKYGPKA